MDRESLIRRMPEIAFALLFGGGLVLGGDAALAGFPKLLDAVVPGMAAEAGVADHRGVARFAVPRGFITEGFADSRFAPQVLYPVAAAPKPDWLVEAIRVARTGAMPALRGKFTGGAPLHARPVIAICIDAL